MTRARTELIYPIGGTVGEPVTFGLLIDSELLGEPLVVQHDGHKVEVTFPSSAAEGDQEAKDKRSHKLFDRFPTELDFPLAEGHRELFAHSLSKGSNIVHVDVLRLAYVHEYHENVPLQSVVETARSRTDPVMALLFDYLRSRASQPWLGLTGTVHQPEVWRVLDLDEKVRYPTPAIAAGQIMVVPPESVLSRDGAASCFDSLSPIALHESLLADASFFEWTHFPQSAAVAVLLAAVASEVHVKAVVRTTASDKAELAEFLLSRPRDFSTAARSLFSDVMKAINGRSLKAEDLTLEKAVGELFETRNRVAHRGEVPTAAQAKKALQTAREASRWLQSVVDGAMPPQLEPQNGGE